MKDRFLKDMKILYPEGIDSMSQLRDLARVFAMGWCDALMEVEAIDKVGEWNEEFAFMADLNWWPDKSWRWW